MKTNAMRILENLNIDYSVKSYEVDLEHLDAIHACNQLGLKLEQVYKTIVMRNSNNENFVFCVPADSEISLKKARVLTKSHDIALLKLELLQNTTGYIRGGCSPLGMKKNFPTFIEELAQIEDYIYVSAGKRGLQIKLKPADLVLASNGCFASII